MSRNEGNVLFPIISEAYDGSTNNAAIYTATEASCLIKDSCFKKASMDHHVAEIFFSSSYTNRSSDCCHRIERCHRSKLKNFGKML